MTKENQTASGNENQTAYIPSTESRPTSELKADPFNFRFPMNEESKAAHERFERRRKRNRERFLAEIRSAAIQCADCQRWISRDKPHTCRQQIERNVRHSAKWKG